MSDSLGNMDWPGTGLCTHKQRVNGFHVPYYIHRNIARDRYQLVRLNPPGIQDSLVREFCLWESAYSWLEREWRAGRLPDASEAPKTDGKQYSQLAGH